MSKTVTIRGDEWSEDELRDLASRPRLDVPVKDEYGRRARLAVHVWQAHHGEGDEQSDDAAAEKTPAVPEQAPTPDPEPKPAEPEAPYIYAHPCPRCGEPVNGGHRNRFCDSCRVKSRKEQIAKSRAKERAKKTAQANEPARDGDSGHVNDALALAVGTLARRLRRAVYAGDATTYRATVDALANIDKVITATGGWKEDKQ
ncbi:hypothetical protein PSRA_0829 [Pseudoscardovia radai]|uniref:Uncharacterized protein n=1 Tax=Pseudoscardovia radai TaxID=987066 RepID=A0A261EXZ9_9BIFI|nr:hypothetical protein [Pseudoscardovia radai]OZG51749.1 hypothetical protein PSRA_0829 [Pseudoscardovia radai]